MALGGWSPDIGADGGGADRPVEAVAAFLGEDSGFAGLPVRGYNLAGVDHGRALFTYSVEGAVKAALVVADTRAGIEVEGAAAGWIVEVFAACDVSEFATADVADAFVTVWRDQEGQPVPTDILHSHPGPAHCDWGSVTFLWLEGRQYLRDPDGVLHASTLAPFLARATLPDDVSDTGYRAGIAELWHAADGSRVYLVTEDRVEAWSATTERVGCR